MNRHPVLHCDDCASFAEHLFLREMRRRNHEGDTIGYDQMFSCTRCGTVRQWGRTAQSVLDWRTRVSEA